MIENHDRIQNDLEELYVEGGRLGATVMEVAFKAIAEAMRKKDLQSLEVSEDRKEENPTLDDFTIESATPAKKLGLEDLTIEQAEPDRKVRQATDPDLSERKVLFGKGENGFVNNLSPEQETAVGKMLMGKPGEEIPGAENLVIRYKGQIIASTNDKGVLEANEIYGKIPPETLQKLAKAIEQTPYANAPDRGAETPTPIEKPQAVTQVQESTTTNVPRPAERSSVPSTPEQIQPMATVPDELKIPKPILRNSVPSGNPVTQVTTVMDAVATPDNGIAALKNEIQTSAPEPVIQNTDPKAIDPQTLTGIAEGSKNKAAGLMNWMRENGTDPNQLGYTEAKSPNGYIGKIELNDTGAEAYTLADPKGKVVFSATLENVGISETGEAISAVEVDVYNSKGIGNEWKAIKASISTPQQPVSIEPTAVAPEIPQQVSNEKLTSLKDFAEAKIVVPDKEKRYGKMESDPNLVMGYEKISDDKTRYQLIDKQNPDNKIAFTYDRQNGSIEDVKQTTTPSMLDMVERINTKMRQENAVLKDDVNRVAVAENAQPGDRSPAPTIKEGNEIPLSSIPPQTTQPAAETAKLNQQQLATVAKSIVIVNAACEANRSQEVELEDTKVSIEEKDKNTKVYTIKDLSSDEESKFSHNKETGSVEIIKESKVVDRLIDKEEGVFSPVIPGYTDVVKTTTKSIDKEPELASVNRGQAASTPNRSVSKTKGKSENSR